MNAEILDFGCGTGLSGLALRMVGYHLLDGIDVSVEMLAEARKKNAYQSLRKCTPGALPLVIPGAYHAITACGVISLGAAPASLLAELLELLAPGGFLVLSYNEATLRAPDYVAALAKVQTSGAAVLRWAEHGPHLPHKQGAQTSTVYVLERQ
jgi:predicted TPR repeat methyltransferase